VKKLTLELWDKIVEAFYRKSLNHLGMVGHATKNEVENYLSFYGVHNSIYWSEQDCEIRGILVVHPGKQIFDWNWPQENGIWTADVVWAEDARTNADLLKQFLEAKHPVKEFYACRRGRLIPLTFKKLERILSYGFIWRRRRHSNTSPTGSKLSRVNARHLEGAGGDGAGSVCQRG
jgi:hypothetical protein